MRIEIHKLPYFSNKNIIGIEPCGHSSFYQTFKVITDSDQYFIKWTDKQNIKVNLEYEFKGLQVLANVIPTSVPRILSYDEYDATRYLIIEFIATDSANHKLADFGKAAVRLAQIHTQQSVHYGLEYDNSLGPLIQINKQNTNWADFFVECRLTPQIELLKRGSDQYFELIHLSEGLIKRVPDVLIQCVPSLLHGDFWSGNLLFNEQGDPYFIDPAISYGHYEVDIAMSKLFGGFSDLFYKKYFEIRPKENGYEDRIRVYQIYFLLVHVNIFGFSYLSQTMAAIRKLL